MRKNVHPPSFSWPERQRQLGGSALNPLALSWSGRGTLADQLRDLHFLSAEPACDPPAGCAPALPDPSLFRQVRKTERRAQVGCNQGSVALSVPVPWQRRTARRWPEETPGLLTCVYRCIPVRRGTGADDVFTRSPSSQFPKVSMICVYYGNVFSCLLQALHHYYIIILSLLAIPLSITSIRSF